MTTETTDTVPTVAFPLPERHALLFDLTTAQVLVLGPAVSLAFGSVYVLRNLASLLFAVLVLALGAVVAFVHVRIGMTRRPLVEWAPIAAVWAGEHVLPGGSRGRYVRAVPERVVDVRTAEVLEALPVPGAGPLKGVAIWPWSLPDGTAFGAVFDRLTGRWLAMVEIRGRHVAMIDTAELVGLQEKWGALVDGLGRESAVVSRLQWVADAGAVDELAATRWLRTRAVVGEDDPARVAQEELIGAGGHAAPEHRLIAVLAVDAARAKRMIAMQGGGREGACEVLGGELDRLRSDLVGAGLVVERILDQRAVSAMLRLAFDPDEAPKLALLAEAGSPGLPPTLAGPQFWEAHGDWIRTAGTFHIAGTVAAWPGAMVPIDFLAPLLADPSISRRIAQTLAPLSPLEAMRQVGAKLATQEANAEIRGRYGFLTRAKSRRRHEAAEAEDEALAHGHGLNREATAVVVSAPTLDEAEAAWSRLESAAAHALVRLERATGLQERVFLATLPLGRGLR